jgi:hypothetical protein
MSSTHGAPPWKKSSPTPTNNLKTTASPSTNEMENLKTLGYKSSTQSATLSTTSFNNSSRPSITSRANINVQGHVHQDHLPAPTMWVTMSAIDNLTLKRMVQTNDTILIAYVRGRNLSHARMRATYTLRARVIHHMSRVRTFCFLTT